jgi:hypothetical protein
VEIGSREGPVAGPLISHLASATRQGYNAKVLAQACSSMST